MKFPHSSFGTAAIVGCAGALLLAQGIPAQGQNSTLPGVPAAAPQTEMQKWLADLDAQWQAAFKRDVGDPYTAENIKLRGQYVAALEAGLTKASGAGDLNAAIVWRNEQKRIAEAIGIPAQDAAADPLPVKQLRATWRSQLPRMEKDRATRAKAMLAKYDLVLAQAQTQLTKSNRIDDAILVKAKRDEVAATWIMPEMAAAMEISTAEVPSKPKPMAPIGALTKEGLTNSLGMKFVPVPGTSILMCIHETRKADYTAFVADNPGINGDGYWKKVLYQGVPVSEADDHPVVAVSWDDAQTFCAWLSKKEGRTYRLPTDREWSYAVGIGPKERK